MKRYVAPILIGACLTTSGFANSEMQAQLEEMKKQIAELKAAQQAINMDALQRQINEVRAHSAGDNVKFDVDFRTSYDIVDYKINNGKSVSNNVWTNKLILGMGAQPREDLVFRGALGVYKAFGQTNMAGTSMFQDFDWYGSQKPNDAQLRLREAYFVYFGKMGEVPYTASFGRRPSVDGFLTNLREDNAYPASPIGHNINMEFDGASFMFDVEKITGVSGMYFKLCLGRGFSEARGSYSSNDSGFLPGYSKDDMNPHMDLAGLMMQLYDDGQYKVMANVFKAWNLMGADMDMGGVRVVGGAPVAVPRMIGFKDVGDMTGGALSFQISGLSYENDFLMDTTVFASYAFSRTEPNSNPTTIFSPAGMNTESGMLGSQDKKTGHSFYVGVQIPGFFEKDKIGFEYNYGSKYWRSFTYGEDTLVGSKLSTRGNAYEMYYNLPLLGKNLTAQLRYTYIDYDYTGSDMFFGQTGTPMKVSDTPGAVESAQNLRLSLRYRY